VQVKQLALGSLKHPVQVLLSGGSEVAEGLHQEFVRIRPAREGDREAIVAGRNSKKEDVFHRKTKTVGEALVDRHFSTRTLLFTSTRQQCHHLRLVLALLGIRCAELHGGLPQPEVLAIYIPMT